MQETRVQLGMGRAPGEGNGNPLHYSCLENLMDRGASQATVHEVARVGHDLATKPTCNFPKISHIRNNHHCSRDLGLRSMNNPSMNILDDNKIFREVINNLATALGPKFMSKE